MKGWKEPDRRVQAPALRRVRVAFSTPRRGKMTYKAWTSPHPRDFPALRPAPTGAHKFVASTRPSFGLYLPPMEDVSNPTSVVIYPPNGQDPSTRFNLEQFMGTWCARLPTHRTPRCGCLTLRRYVTHSTLPLWKVGSCCNFFYYSILTNEVPMFPVQERCDHHLYSEIRFRVCPAASFR